MRREFTMLVVVRSSLAPLAARSLVGRTEPRLVAVMINRRAWEDVDGVLMMAEVAEVDDGLTVAVSVPIRPRLELIAPLVEQRTLLRCRSSRPGAIKVVSEALGLAHRRFGRSGGLVRLDDLVLPPVLKLDHTAQKIIRVVALHHLYIILDTSM